MVVCLILNQDKVLVLICGYTKSKKMDKTNNVAYKLPEVKAMIQSRNQSPNHPITFHVILLYFRFFDKHSPFITISSLSLLYGKQ